MDGGGGGGFLSRSNIFLGCPSSAPIFLMVRMALS